jgi:hypothetical protein
MENGKLKILGIALLLLVAGSVVSCRGKVKAVSADRAATGVVFEISDSTFVADTLDFGTMHEGEVVEKEFRIKNVSDKPFVVINVKSDCGCTLFGFNREPVGPDEEKVITASFDSAGYLGEVIKKASLQTSLSETAHTIIVEARVE